MHDFLALFEVIIFTLAHGSIVCNFVAWSVMSVKASLGD